MNLTVGADALGISEAAWSQCRRLRAIQPFVLPHHVRHIAVISPHPDDETFATGGFLSMLKHVDVTVIAVTDGERSHPRSQTLTRADLTVVRDEERRQAMHALGISAEIERLRIPDGGVAEADLAARLRPLLADVDLCLAPYLSDGHPDHDATGHAAARACVSARIPLVEYPVWAWHWARPNSDDLPWRRARRIPLTASAYEKKVRAVFSYRSQVEPLSPAPGDEAILPPAVLERFLRPYEVMFV